MPDIMFGGRFYVLDISFAAGGRSHLSDDQVAETTLTISNGFLRVWGLHANGAIDIGAGVGNGVFSVGENRVGMQ